MSGVGPPVLFFSLIIVLLLLGLFPLHINCKISFFYTHKITSWDIDWDYIASIHQVWRRQWQPTPVGLPGKSHGRRSLVGCSQWGHKESDTTERPHFHFSLSCIGEGNGNPLQCSCLENPKDGGAWWAAVHRITQSWTRLKRLSSSSIAKLGLPKWL